jgi:hypothetical protein
VRIPLTFFQGLGEAVAMGLDEKWEMEAGTWWLFCLEGLKDIKAS